MGSILRSSTAKQIAGALMGMAAASAVYLGVQQMSTASLSGMLVQSGVVSENADRVRVNDKTINDAALERIARHAKEVSQQLEDSKVPVVVSSTPALVQNAEDRGARRAFVQEAAQKLADAPVYDANPNVQMSEKDRLAIRMARVQGIAQASAASSVTAVKVAAAPTRPVRSSVFSAASSTSSVMHAAAPLHEGAEIADVPHSTQLPSSGLGLNLLVLATFLAAFFGTRSPLRDRVVALVKQAH